MVVSVRSVPGMLRESDLDSFVRLVERAQRRDAPPSERNPDCTLRADGDRDDLVHRSEYARLWKSLKIASAAGDIPESCCRIFDAIARDLTAEDHRYLSLAHTEEWLDAIHWATTQPRPSAFDSLRNRGLDRQFHVGTACRRLRERDIQISIGTFGPHLDGQTRSHIGERINSLIAEVGGVNAVVEIFRFMRETGKLHDGMWLFGNIPGAVDRASEPAIPLGWLLSLALQNLHKTPSTDQQAEPWESAIRLAIDFAASMDCQRYNPYEGFSLEAPDFLFSLTESLTWRELFTLPQVPRLVLPTLRNAFSQIEWPEETADLAAEVDRSFAELDRLVAGLRVDSPTRMSLLDGPCAFPLLWQHARVAQGKVNPGYLDPFGERPRNQDRFVFFEIGDGTALVLPPALTAAAGCEAIFRRVWKRAKKAAKNIVGDTIEKSVAIACRRHSPHVSEKLHYFVRKQRLEMDVAVRDGPDIVLFEAKAKMLTAPARTGDMMKFLVDYTDSFLALLQQLVRHDHNIKLGLTPLAGPDDGLAALRVTKIAVSPLSFGPASDHLLSNALMNAIANAQLVSADSTPDRTVVLNAFNTTIRSCMEDIDKVAPRSDGLVDLGRYMMRVSWLDLGQLLYCLSRGRSVVDAVSALMHLTFNTRDFWTEVAFAERRGLTNRPWHPLHPESPTPD